MVLFLLINGIADADIIIIDLVKDRLDGSINQKGKGRFLLHMSLGPTPDN
jgi:hypothetical protein